jgi:repressor LexA
MNDQPTNSNRPATTGGGSAYTPKQGQYLAFIYYYTKLNGVPPAERDMQLYFRTAPPSVHQMVVTLEKRRLIERVPGQSRSIRLLVTRQDIPDLE